jgi:hypothetical protein
MSTIVHFVCRALVVVVLAVVGLLLSFVSMGVFAGYPQYHTDVLSVIGLLLIMAIGGAAWIIDERRIDAEG